MLRAVKQNPDLEGTVT